MASSSKRLTRSAIEKQISPSFRTIIDPHKEQFQLSPKFKSEWGDKIVQEPVAFLVHPSGNTAWLEFHVQDEQCYMTGGKIASLLFGIREPTEVILTYHQEDTTITLRKVSNVEQVNNQTMKPFERNTYTLHQFDDDGMFGWEQTVTKALASETKNQVLRIPPNCGQFTLRGKNSIIIKTLHNLDGSKWTINTYTRKNGRKEKSFTEGWYAFKKANNLAEGDKLRLKLSDPPHVMTVEIVRANNPA